MLHSDEKIHLDDKYIFHQVLTHQWSNGRKLLKFARRKTTSLCSILLIKVHLLFTAIIHRRNSFFIDPKLYDWEGRGTFTKSTIFGTFRDHSSQIERYPPEFPAPPFALTEMQGKCYNSSVAEPGFCSGRVHSELRESNMRLERRGTT